ncbi:hypothetical protein BGZ60DRAFT_416729 [Tricladium varicosporioides]|nr:hypothetical protein BGZ60DRAFT_416729 [Hymenoscyphus varicosporioides]
MVQTPTMSLAPAIFLPYLGPSTNPPPILDSTQKLQRIVDNLASQQEQVRQNMFSLVQRRANNAIARAKEELDSLERGEDGESLDSDLLEEEEDEDEVREKEVRRREVDEMFERLKDPMGKDSKEEDYELKIEDLIASANVDVQMGNTPSTAAPKPRTAKVIREELSQYLKDIVDNAVVEMEACDVHGERFASGYKAALERRTGKPMAAPTASTQPPSAAPVVQMGSRPASRNTMNPLQGSSRTSTEDGLGINPSRRMSAGAIFASVQSPTCERRSPQRIEDIVGRRDSR